MEKKVTWKSKSELNMAKAKQDMSTLGFSVIEGIDPNPSNATIAFLFNTAAQKVPVLSRLESDPKTRFFRITTKCYSPVLSLATCQVLRTLIN